jgi:ADP-ribose pyrophosphatase
MLMAGSAFFLIGAQDNRTLRGACFGIVSAMTEGSRPRARVLSSRPVFRGPVFAVFSDRVLEPGGVRARRDVVRHPGSVVVLALEERKGRERRVLLERQFRYVAGRRLWELPAGRIDVRESALAAARRELQEETGYTATRWQRAFTFWASPGFLDERMTVYLARGLVRGRSRPEDDERIAVRSFPLSRAVAMVGRGLIEDAKTIAGLLWAERFALRRR